MGIGKRYTHNIIITVLKYNLNYIILLVSIYHNYYISMLLQSAYFFTQQIQ